MHHSSPSDRLAFRICPSESRTTGDVGYSPIFTGSLITTKISKESASCIRAIWRSTPLALLKLLLWDMCLYGAVTVMVDGDVMLLVPGEYIPTAAIGGSTKVPCVTALIVNLHSRFLSR